eukprot:gene29876-37002_t
MKVGTRLGLGFALVLLFLIAVTAVGIVRMAQIQDRLDHVVSFNNVVTRLVIDMRNNVNERVSSLRTLTLMSDPADMEPEMKRIKELSDKYAAHQKKLEAQFALEATAEEKALMAAIKEHEAATMPAIAKASELWLSNQAEAATKVMIKEIRPPQKKWMESLDQLGEPYKPELDAVNPMMERAERNAGVVMGQQKILTQVGDALRTINRQSSDLLEIAETVSSLKLQQNAPASEISAAGQLVMLTQRIGKSANEFQTMEGVSPEAVFLLGKDLNSFKEIAQGMLDGSPELRLAATKDAQTREQLDGLVKLYEQTRTQASAILGNLQGLVSAREAQSAIIADSEPLRRQLETLQSKLSAQTGVGAGQLAALVLASAFLLVCGFLLSRVQLLDSRNRQRTAEVQQKDAKRQEQEAKRVNDANQAAILRLMNELQSVAEGDLTQEATVTEDITGAIADSVNYTVEELRQLVGSVQNTATRVAQTTAQVDSTSTELLAASTEQLREIRETGRSVLDMATRINEVSTQDRSQRLAGRAKRHRWYELHP